MSPIKQLIFALIAVLVFTTACTNHSDIDGVSITEIEPEAPDDEPPPLIDVCKPLDVPGVAFPRQEYVEGPRTMMAAELVGKLELVDGCLQVDSLYGDGAVIPVWPAEYTIAVEGDSLTIFDGEGPADSRGQRSLYGGR